MLSVSQAKFIVIPLSLVIYFCPVADPGGTLPEWPTDFSTAIEANILEKNYSLEIREYFDYTNNRLRIDTHYHNGSAITWEFFDSVQFKISPITNLPHYRMIH